MARLSKEDLAQMNRDYFQSLTKERLVEVADNLYQLAVEQWEKIHSDSSNSCQPPSSDNPFHQKTSPQKSGENEIEELNSPSKKDSFHQDQNKKFKQKRKPGRQKGSKGFGRTKRAESISNHSTLPKSM